LGAEVYIYYTAAADSTSGKAPPPIKRDPQTPGITSEEQEHPRLFLIGERAPDTQLIFLTAVIDAGDRIVRASGMRRG